MSKEDKKISEKKTFTVSDKEPEFVPQKGESAEDFMARLHYTVGTNFPTPNGKFVNLDGNNDGKLTGQEAKNAVTDPIFAFLPDDVKNNLLERAEHAIKGNYNLKDINALKAEMNQTQVIVMEDGTKIPAEKGRIPDRDLKNGDMNHDGRISVGEFQYKEIKSMETPEKPQENLPKKKPQASLGAKRDGGIA